ncbi:MAG: cyclase family protein [Bacteroidota bacterium]
MKAKIELQGKEYVVDLNKPIDISIPLKEDKQPNCFYAPKFRIEPVVADSFIGDTTKGSPVNFKNVFINPHGNGTHTECVGHISKRKLSIHKVLQNFHFIAKLHTVSPLLRDNGDQVIVKETLVSAFNSEEVFDAIVIRTQPNGKTKLSKNYSGSNPPYFENNAIQFLIEKGIQHLLVDIPSVDREVDGGKIINHKTFWNYPKEKESNKTITEMVFINNRIKDGVYLLNLQIISLELDASPSKPVLYKIESINTIE